MALSETLEDYLEIILQLSLRHKNVRVTDIAQAKKVRMPTVTWALGRLSEKGLVHYRARQYVQLTDLGGAIARKTSSRHRFLMHFLSRILGVPADAAEQDACGLEHHLSSHSLERLAAFVEYIETCPQVKVDFLSRFRDCFGKPEGRTFACAGVPCLVGEGGVVAPRRGGCELVSVSKLSVGVKGEVARVKGPERTRRNLVRRGLLPGAVVEKMGPARGKGPVVVSTQGQELTLTLRDANLVFVEVIGEREEAVDARV
ncbi:MAG: metal-dependent transcriptional regulator [Candidatus Eisenbacteria sp.]|nr:metal-dependent transcriptional regulator [Candidatus Eisenbacteria bacterium]